MSKLLAHVGGGEDSLRSNFDYTRITADRLSGGRNSWAFRGVLSGVSTTSGVLLPLDARIFAGEDLVRGFRAGEITPYVVANSTSAAGAASERAQAVGANFVLAFNGEYRVPLEAAGPRTQAVAFFDSGSGWLLPRWLGVGRPRVLDGTSGAWRASSGFEIRFTLPRLEQTLRLHYSWNPLRLARSLFLPNGSIFRAPERRSGFGWALGSLF